MKPPYKAKIKFYEDVEIQTLGDVGEKKDIYLKNKKCHKRGDVIEVTITEEKHEHTWWQYENGESAQYIDDDLFEKVPTELKVSFHASGPMQQCIDIYDPKFAKLPIEEIFKLIEEGTLIHGMDSILYFNPKTNTLEQVGECNVTFSEMDFEDLKIIN